MHHQELAQILISADKNSRLDYLNQHSSLADKQLAYILKNICHDCWHNEPSAAKAASESLKSLYNLNNDSEILALYIWSNGLVFLSESKLDNALENFDEAQTNFDALMLTTQSASVQANKVVALAILGRYDEAIEIGLKARGILKQTGEKDILGNLEYNIGNLFLRRNYFEDAEKYLNLAHNTAVLADNKFLLARIKNSLAMIKSSQNQFRNAEKLYNEALLNAEASNQILLKAVIEANIGEFSYFQGHYGKALSYLENARRTFSECGDEQRSLLIALEIANAYLELNLYSEAIETYQNIITDFKKRGMRAEQARVYSQLGRAFSSLKQFDVAQENLEKAARLYESENNPIGAALTNLTLAQIFYEQSKNQEALDLAEKAESVFSKANTWRHTLTTRLLRSEIEKAKGNTETAENHLHTTLNDAALYNQPQIEQRCLTLLGLLKKDFGNFKEAEDCFKKSIELIENLRAPLPGEEFSTAFFSDKLIPYDEMTKLCLAENENNRVEEALHYVEKSRSRALVDNLVEQIQKESLDEFETKIIEELESTREELNRYYTQIERNSLNLLDNESDELAKLNLLLKERESRTSELLRQLRHKRLSNKSVEKDSLEIETIQNYLGDHTALIEYTNLDGEWLAFVITDEGVSIVRNLGNTEEVKEAIENFYFQIDSLRHGAANIRQHLTLLTKRINRSLNTLYNFLLKPIENLTGARRLVIVPYKDLHYIPFHALFDDANYLLEKHEICYTPSVLILKHSLSKPHNENKNAVLFGISDERAPKVREEIEKILPFFTNPISFLDEAATISSFKTNAPQAGILHLACHGHFRQDNPLFSTLKLGDGWLTVHDISRLNLQCELVTLSACETGVNLIAPGDELLGLTRGFFSAGVSSLIMTLWQVDDEATASLMTNFYEKIRNGVNPISALRQAQIKLMKEKQHPFFWSPFIFIGRW